MKFSQSSLQQISISIASFALFWLGVPAFAQNVADPKQHPYADPAGGREGYADSDKQVNEARIYDFYQRQADYYLTKGSADVPAILPAYPGLDGGSYGHWGKHNQKNYND